MARGETIICLEDITGHRRGTDECTASSNGEQGNCFGYPFVLSCILTNSNDSY